jgi:superfamily II DNA or RNA helicase
MSKTLKKFIKDNDPRVLLLSATVYSSSPWNIYNLAFYLGHQWNYRNFSDAFFDQIRMGARVIPVAKKNCEERLSNAVKKIASIVDISDCMDIPPQNHLEPEYFALTKEQVKGIEESYDPLPIVRYTRQHEVEQGVLIGNEFTDDKFFEADKNARLLDIIKENKKVAIIARYNLQIDFLKDMLKGFNPLVIRGDVKNRHEICELAENSESSIVLIQADCAEGYQLPSFSLVVFMSMSYSYVKYEQLCGRFLRMDKPSPTTFIYLFTEGDSMDNGVYQSVRLKEDFNINLYGKTRS